MEISEIRILWEPTAVTDEVVRDMLAIRGQLLNKGNVVAELPAIFWVMLYSHPQEGGGPDITLWSFVEPINADEAIIELYNTDSNHTLVINGKNIILPVQYENMFVPFRFNLEVSPGPPKALLIIPAIAVLALLVKKRR